VDVSRLDLVDEAFGMRTALRVEPRATCFRFPVETASQSESGFERQYQGSGLYFCPALPPVGTPISIELRILPISR
jgi:hypothetical protein